jgi:hypothetical protein
MEFIFGNYSNYQKLVGWYLLLLHQQISMNYEYLLSLISYFKLIIKKTVSE